MDVVAAVGADQQAAAVVQPGEGSFDDSAVAADRSPGRACSRLNAVAARIMTAVVMPY